MPLETLLSLTNDQTKIVPGTGPVLSRADVQAEHDMLVTLKRRLSEALAKGMSVEDMIAAALTRDFDAKWGDPVPLHRERLARSRPSVARARRLNRLSARCYFASGFVMSALACATARVVATSVGVQMTTRISGFPSGTTELCSNTRSP